MNITCSSYLSTFKLLYLSKIMFSYICENESEIFILFFSTDLFISLYDNCILPELLYHYNKS